MNTTPAVPSEGLSIASWANAITTARLLLSPVMFWIIPDQPGGAWIAFGFWFVLCFSDGIDGYVARRRGPTAAGAFLDPLADKVLVLGATMAYFGEGIGQYTGIGLASLGVWGFFPSARPLISDIVDRIPMLAKKTDEGPRIED